MADLCCVVGCRSVGTKFCGACGLASYCSVDCQRGDWKVHKLSCINTNKLPTTFLTESEIFKFYKKIYAQVDNLEPKGKIKDAINILQKCLAFLEHQCGVQVEGKSYCKRSNGDRIDNSLLIEIRIRTGMLTYLIHDSDVSLAYAIAARQMLSHRNQLDNQNIILLTATERLLSSLYMQKKEFDVAEHHCEQYLMFARLNRGDYRITRECHALINYASLRMAQFRSPEATDLSEKAYILASEAYGPVHPEVQEAASQLIRCLIESGDYSKADDYCRMNYENLTHPRYGIDQCSAAIADGMLQISELWLKMPPVDDVNAAFALAEEAEDMARKSCQLMDTHWGKDSFEMVRHHNALVDVLLKRGKQTNETKMVFHWEDPGRR